MGGEQGPPLFPSRPTASFTFCASPLSPLGCLLHAKSLGPARALYVFMPRCPVRKRTAARKGFPVHDFQSAESWLRKALRNAPKPLPSGVFPKLLDEAEQAGFSHSTLNDVVDEWLNFGYCRVTDHVSNDIALTPEGDEYFGHRTIDE